EKQRGQRADVSLEFFACGVLQLHPTRLGTMRVQHVEHHELLHSNDEHVHARRAPAARKVAPKGAQAPTLTFSHDMFPNEYAAQGLYSCWR
ncbi:unnamed protein product, partial [Ectocarpus sp. 8 AP-2014]